MPAVGPLIGVAATVVSGMIARNQAQKARAQAAPLVAAQTALAQQQAAIAKLAGPAMAETSDYYRKLLHGDKASMNAALAPEIQSITELSRGAERGLDRGPAGPQRDVARAELGRSRVGQIGALFPQARRMGAEGLTNLGTVAMGGARTASSIYESLLSGERDDARMSNDRMSGLGEGLGPLLVDFYKAWQGRSGGGGNAASTATGLRQFNANTAFGGTTF